MKRAVLRMKGDGEKEGEVVELLDERYQMHDGRSDLPLLAYRGYEEVVGMQKWEKGGKVGNHD